MGSPERISFAPSGPRMARSLRILLARFAAIRASTAAAGVAKVFCRIAAAVVADGAGIAMSPIAVAISHSPIKNLLPVFFTMAVLFSWNRSCVIGECRHHEKPARAQHESSAQARRGSLVQAPRECLVRAPQCGWKIHGPIHRALGRPVRMIRRPGAAGAAVRPGPQRDGRPPRARIRTKAPQVWLVAQALAPE